MNSETYYDEDVVICTGLHIFVQKQSSYNISHKSAMEADKNNRAQNQNRFTVPFSNLFGCSPERMPLVHNVSNQPRTRTNKNVHGLETLPVMQQIMLEIIQKAK